ncbi:hypothetical protein ACJ73_01989 [Blastomyces percursus]|uniref:Uncharacterized protein n=1 Tax=Blastomyces percursus TaxID=1658174 RepID=A0A1J9RG53_9EURO|nr:hypothetical protein ACJ73_01989 [Blastomyces percursus]
MSSQDLLRWILLFDTFYDDFPFPTNPNRNEGRKDNNANKTETGTSRPNSYDRVIWKLEAYEK